MKFYKLNKYVAAGLLLATVLSSGCKKYLNEQPITSVGPEFVFSDVPNTFKAITGVYSQLTGDQGYGIRLSLYYPVDNDETQGPSGSDGGRRPLSRYETTPANTELEKPFQQLFRGIEYANICISKIPQMDLYSNGSDQQKKQLQRMYGEALTLRAQFYLEAIRNWGDLPAHFLPAAELASKDPFPGRTDRDTLYNHLLDDLKIAEDLVPWRNEVASIGDGVDERITKGTVKGLRARIALFRGGYALRIGSNTMERRADYAEYIKIARDECKEIIASGQHSLNPSYKALWKDQVGAHAVTDPNGELMFQVATFGLTAAADSKLGYYNGPADARSSAAGNKSINILGTYFYAFDSSDLRRDVTCAPYNIGADGNKIGAGITGINDGKYRKDWITHPTPVDGAQYFGLKWQILRYSDVLLMFAEAENELEGPTQAAYDAVNAVRRRGFGKPLGTPDADVDLPAGLSKADFFNAVVNERSFELGGEGVRKYDLIRWNLLATKLAATKQALADMVAGVGIYEGLPTSMYYVEGSAADDASLWATSFYAEAPSSTPAGSKKIAWVGSSITTTVLGRYAIGFVSNKGELLPFPQSAIDANFNLKPQNPGY